MTPQAPMTKQQIRKWLNSLPPADQQREREVATANRLRLLRFKLSNATTPAGPAPRPATLVEA